MPEIDNLRDRVYQLESIVYELPNLMNTRLDGLESHLKTFRVTIDSNGTRLGQLERITGLLQADVRDLRVSMLVQMRLQSDELAKLDGRLTTIEKKLESYDDTLKGVDGRLARLETAVTEQGRRLDSVEGLLRAIATKLDIT